MSDSPEVDPKVWVSPPLIDLQVNGFSGVDFQQDGLSRIQLEKAATSLLAAGCTRFFPTFISDRWGKLMARLRNLLKVRQQSELLTQMIAGIHLEGPWLSPESGFRGAHDATVMCDPNLEQVEELEDVASMLRVLITLAPERSNSIGIIHKAREMGIKVFLGHSNASSGIIKCAAEAGAIGFTHLGNGCPQMLDRHDNIVWRVLDQQSLSISLIPDGIHVSPMFFRLVHRLLPAERIIYTADAMSAAGAPPGVYKLGNKELEVGSDKIVRMPGQTNFAGSALTPIEGVLKAAEMLEVSWRAVWRHFSTHPENLMDLPSSLQVGARADFCIIPQTGAELFDSMVVYLNGQQAVYDRAVS